MKGNGTSDKEVGLMEVPQSQCVAVRMDSLHGGGGGG